MMRQLIARLDAIGQLLGSLPYNALVEERLKGIDPLTGWTKPDDALPDEKRDVFFITEGGTAWAGQRDGEDWCDWGDKGLICTTADVLVWLYKPEVSR